jgi:hypothetical protein
MKKELNNDVLINRKILGWEWYKDITTYKLFTHLIYKANYVDDMHRGVKVLRGQVYTGLDKLQFETGLSLQNIKTSLKKLILTSNITSKSTNKYRIITVVKYNDYQLANKQTNKQTKQQLTSELTASKEYKELLNEVKELKKELSNSKKGVNDSDKKDKEKPVVKLKYLEFVLLTEDEHTKLKEKFNSRLDSQIENLNNYIGSTGKKYKSHYHTLLSWDRKNSIDNKQSISDEELNRKYGADND